MEQSLIEQRDDREVELEDANQTREVESTLRLQLDSTSAELESLQFAVQQLVIQRAAGLFSTLDLNGNGIVDKQVRVGGGVC